MAAVTTQPGFTAGTDNVMRLALIVGGAGIAVSLVFPFLGEDLYRQFFRSYLTAYMFVAGAALGSLCLLMIQHMTGGAWGFATRRMLEAATRTLPLVLVFFLPIFVGMNWVGDKPTLYEWTNEAAVKNDQILYLKSGYLNPTFFYVRQAIYWAIWLGIMWCLNRWSKQEDETGDSALLDKFQTVSGPGIVLFALTITFASIDWTMSIDARWYSTMYGVIVGVGTLITALSMIIVSTVLLGRYPPLRDTVTKLHLRDLGCLLLALIMFWMYISFSQYLLIWAGNLRIEVPYIINRSTNGWQFVGMALIGLHFFLPFLILLTKDVKRNATRLMIVAIWVLLMRFVDNYYLVIPSYGDYPYFVGDTARRFKGLLASLSPLDLTTVVGLGGLWVAFYVYQLKRMPLLPLKDRRIGQELWHGLG